MIAYGLLLGTALLVVAIWMKLHKVFRLFRVTRLTDETASPDSLPSVSLCIPARNETHAMTACLESALSSRYPKLEIIVLDDASRDDTSHLIKSFAHAGVRFVEGSPLPHGWLGKNHALEGLLGESSGSLILFADVDTRFSPGSINQMVAYMQQESAEMVSVLPMRQRSLLASAVVATLRHFWSLIGHTRRRPAVSSSAWLVKRSVIVDELHGFGDLALAIRPERSIAQLLAARNSYRYIISSPLLGITYEKKLSSQRETGIRIYYPDFGLGGVLLRLIGLALCLAPYILLVVGLVQFDIGLTLWACADILLLSAVNSWYLSVLWSHNFGLASICLPYILLHEMYLMSASVVMNKAGRVTWKGRSITRAVLSPVHASSDGEARS